MNAAWSSPTVTSLSSQHTIRYSPAPSFVPAGNVNLKRFLSPSERPIPPRSAAESPALKSSIQSGEEPSAAFHASLFVEQTSLITSDPEPPDDVPFSRSRLSSVRSTALTVPSWFMSAPAVSADFFTRKSRRARASFAFRASSPLISPMRAARAA